MIFFNGKSILSLNHNHLGPHFRNGVIMHYLFVVLKEEKVNLSFNFFCECHGKNDLDQHFSRVTIFIRNSQIKNQLKSTEDIIYHIMNEQKSSNLWREKINKSPINVIALELRHTNEINELQLGLFIENMKYYYSFNNINSKLELRTSIFSDLSISKQIDFKIEYEKKRKNTIVNEIEKTVKNTELEFPKMLKKFLAIEKNLSNFQNPNLFCTELCLKCTVPLLNNLSSKTKATIIREELVKHNHIARKYVNKKLKFKSKKEAMLELKMHYDKCHNSSFL